MAGLLDLFTGGGEQAAPANGMTPEEQAQQDTFARRARMDQFGQIGAVLFAAGQKQMPAQRAEALQNLGPALSTYSRAMQQQQKAQLEALQVAKARQELVRDRQFREMLPKYADALMKAYPDTLTPEMIATLPRENVIKLVQDALQSPEKKKLEELKIKELEAALATQWDKVEVERDDGSGYKKFYFVNKRNPSEFKTLDQILAGGGAAAAPQQTQLTPEALQRAGEAQLQPQATSAAPVAAPPTSYLRPEGMPVMPVSKVARQEADKTLAKSVIDAREALPSVETEMGGIIKTINSALSHPGLRDAIGLGALSGASFAPSSNAANFMTFHNQLQGEAFKLAYQTMRGAGAIDKNEGAKAEQAIARLGRMQSPEAYKAALKELQAVAIIAIQNQRLKAGVGYSAELPIPVRRPSELSNLPPNTRYIRMDDLTIRAVPGAPSE